MKKIALLMSGGMDSLVALHKLLKEFPEHEVVTIFGEELYHPAHALREQSAYRVVSDYVINANNIEFDQDRITLRTIKGIGPWYLGSDDRSTASTFPVTILKTIDTMNEYEYIATGHIYTDSSYWLVRQYIEDATLALLQTVLPHNRRIEAFKPPKFIYPNRQDNKASIVDSLDRIDSKLKHLVTWCNATFELARGVDYCGNCTSCSEIAEGLKEARISEGPGTKTILDNWVKKLDDKVESDRIVDTIGVPPPLPEEPMATLKADGKVARKVTDLELES